MKPSLNLASRHYFNELAVKWVSLSLVLILLLLVVWQTWACLEERRQKQVLQRDIRQLESQLESEVTQHYTPEQVAEQQQKIDQAESLLQRDAFRWTALFDRLEGLLPENVSIRSFSPNYQKGSLQISGVAKNLIDLQDLLDNLHGESFQQVFLTNQRQAEVLDYLGNERMALEFSIRLEGVF